MFLLIILFIIHYSYWMAQFTSRDVCMFWWRRLICSAEVWMFGGQDGEGEYANATHVVSLPIGPIWLSLPKFMFPYVIVLCWYIFFD